MMWYTVVVSLLFYLSFVCVTSYDISYVEINGNRYGYVNMDQMYFITKVGSHNYTDGDLIKFTCGFYSLDNNDSAWASITSNAYELVNISTKPKCLYKRKSIDLYLKLSSEHDRKVISCHVNESSGQRRTSISQITLTRVNKNRDIGFLVNGARATQINSSINYKDLFFLYTHYNMETILVQSFTNKTLYGSISCDDAENVQSQPTISYTKVLSDWDTRLNCQVDGVTINKRKITLEFKKNAAALFNPTIRGLSMSRTLAMFHRDVNTLVILYKYYVDEVLDLECKSGIKFPEWKLDDSKAEILSENKFRNKEEFLNNATFKLKTGEETASISCIVSSDDVKKAVDITLVVKIKNIISTMSTSSGTSAKKDILEIHINQVEWINNRTTDREHSNYFYIYDFFNGETVSFRCVYTGNETASIIISSNAYEYMNITSDFLLTSPLWLKLNAEHDGKYVECSVDELDGELPRSSVIRVYLALAQRIPGFGFRINGEIAPQIPCRLDFGNRLGLCYGYGFFMGENVTVETFKNETLYGKMNCEPPYGELKPQSNISFSKVLQTELEPQEKNVMCEVKPAQPGVVNTTVVMLSFVWRDVTVQYNQSYIKVIGLSQTKSLAKFERNASVTSLIYETSDDEVLRLECFSRILFPTWIYNDSLFDVAVTEKSRTSYSSIGSFRLNTAAKFGLISCVSPRIPTKNSTAAVDIMIVRRNDTSKERKPGSDDGIYQSGRVSHTILTIVLALVALVVVATIIILWRVRVRRKKVAAEAAEDGDTSLQPRHLYERVVYETIKNQTTVVYDNLYDVNAREVPPPPLPPRNPAQESSEESDTELPPYDITYEWRIEQFGTADVPDRYPPDRSTPHQLSRTCVVRDRFTVNKNQNKKRK